MMKRNRFKVYPYKQGSRSAKQLANSLGGRVLKLKDSIYKPRFGDVVVNWGSSNVPAFAPATVLNRDVGAAQCKLATFNVLWAHSVSVPLYYIDKATIPADAYPVVCRTVLRGHSGVGIVIANTPEELVDAPLYTKYVKKQHEYRVHVMRDAVFFIQRKARKLDVDNPNWKVRNLAGGFIFVEEDILDVPEDVTQQALDAISALGLDFGGVDVIWNEKEGKAYVLEINTACGLEERTAEKYAEVLESLQ